MSKRVLAICLFTWLLIGTNLSASSRVIEWEAANKWTTKLAVSGPINVTYPSLRAGQTYAEHSVLSSGKWRKLSVTQSGLYRLTYDDIVKLGFNPAKVQVYGYGGKLLSEDFRKGDYLDDLPPVAMWLVTGSDGVFNSGDYLLFYAQGPISWALNNTKTYLTRTRNHYSDKAYYFLGERQEGSLVANRASSTLTPNRTVTTYTDLLLHEKELVSMGESVKNSGTGRELFGEDLYTMPYQTFTFNVADIDTTALSTMIIETAAYNSATSYANVNLNGSWVGTLSMWAYNSSGSGDYNYGKAANRAISFRPRSNTLQVDVEYIRNGNVATPRAYLNYIQFNLRRPLKVASAPFTFRDPASVAAGAVASFMVEGAGPSTLVFDVTDPVNMTLVDGNLTGSTFRFVASTATLREYACVNLTGSIPKPTIEGAVTNQDLHAHQPDMVIIAPPIFREQALRLAQAHTTMDGLSVLIVTPEQVYNEFSSGTPDATAYRRMMKLYYDRATNEDELPDYLLLFGGGVYDNRMVSTAFSKGGQKRNWLLTYQSVESLEGESSFVTDDYFGFLDDTEGANLAAAKLDIGIGRFPVHSVQQAKAVVDKTLNYMKNKRKGPWKNRLLYLADDGDGNIHTIQAESLASSVEITFPQFMVNRIYVDAYKKVTEASGVTIPDGVSRFSDLMDMGLLMLNYTGHGSTTEWAEEKILTQARVKDMVNTSLPLWVTATCDFTRFDSGDESGGESAFLNPRGGAIALFTTTRIVYASNNYMLNQQFTNHIFSRRNGKRNTLGEIMYLTKSSAAMNGDSNKLSFTLIGDPAMKLAYPEYSVAVTHINGKPVSAAIDTFQALQTVTIEGNVYTEDGSFADTFNGVVHPTILDAASQVKTLGSNGADIFTYYDRTKVLFTGKDSVVNGRFRFSFVVPKDIQYSYKQGRINLYVCDNASINEGHGYFDKFALGGTYDQAVQDTVGPTIRLFLNDTTWTPKQSVNETPTLIAKVTDNVGLNSSTQGIGHDFQLVIDDDPNQVYSLSNYYMADVGSFQSGTVQYVLPTLTAGKHNLTFRAWDVNNNASVQRLSFTVNPGQEPVLRNLIAARLSDSYQFRFEHNRPDVPVTVTMSVVSLMGQVCWEETTTMQAGQQQSDILEWNLVDTRGRRVPGGIYLCRVRALDATGGEAMIAEKIQVLPQ
ncbi:MAG: type IX secretion system sortase PorU [Bacteroidales bacterium]|jgi:hypothetical protein|nr:type IX secretion system sortase PorU [Bacteroidales bacterium]